MTTTCELRMPGNYLLLDSDEMEYTEGGTYYNWRTCRSKYYYAQTGVLTAANAMSGDIYCSLGGQYQYAGYGALILMYQYQMKQYKKGWYSGKGVDYISPFCIKPRT